MARGGPEESWTRTLLSGLGALAAASLVIGAVVGAVAVGAARVAGMGESSTEPDAFESLSMPPYSKTPQVEESPLVEGGPTPQVTAVPLDPTVGSPTARVGEITLFASPTRVAPGERINLDGVYVDGEGVSLQVQRRDGDAWVDFPTTASVSGGAFGTYIYTGRRGDNVFRVFDPTTGRSSNPVTVTVG